jgi:hypothetical protein
MKVAILLGSTHIGGGTYVIFQHALHLRRRGWDVTIVTLQPVKPSDVSWHPNAAAELVFKTFEEVESTKFDVALATWFKTVYWLHRIQATSYLYFVQSIESRFFESWNQAAISFAEATYLPRLPVVTEATWIRDYLATSYGTKAELAKNGIRKDIYTQEGPTIEPRLPGRLRILVEGPLGVFFKNVEKTIELCRKSSADEIWFLTSSPSVTAYPGVDRVFTCVPVEETAAIYRSCDVIVKLSYVEGMFGPPLEMFHCGGTAIVFNVTGHEEYIAHDHNALVVRKDDNEGVIQAINSLRSDRELLKRLKANALQTAAGWPDWETASEDFLRALDTLSKLPCESRDSLSSFSRIIGSWYDSHAIAQTESQGRCIEREQLRMILGSPSFRMIQKVRRLPGISLAVRGLRRVKKACRA